MAQKGSALAQGHTTTDMNETQISSIPEPVHLPRPQALLLCTLTEQGCADENLTQMCRPWGWWREGVLGRDADRAHQGFCLAWELGSALNIRSLRKYCKRNLAGDWGWEGGHPCLANAQRSAGVHIKLDVHIMGEVILIFPEIPMFEPRP